MFFTVLQAVKEWELTIARAKSKLRNAVWFEPLTQPVPSATQPNTTTQHEILQLTCNVSQNGLHDVQQPCGIMCSRGHAWQGHTLPISSSALAWHLLGLTQFTAIDFDDLSKNKFRNYLQDTASGLQKLCTFFWGEGMQCSHTFDSWAQQRTSRPQRPGESL